MAAGITVSTANSSYTPLELAHALQLSSASIILVHSDLIDTAIKACELAGVEKDKIYLLPGEKGVGEGFRSWEEINGTGNGFETVKFTEEELKGRIACEWFFFYFNSISFHSLFVSLDCDDNEVEYYDQY